MQMNERTPVRFRVERQRRLWMSKSGEGNGDKTQGTVHESRQKGGDDNDES